MPVEFPYLTKHSRAIRAALGMLALARELAPVARAQDPDKMGIAALAGFGSAS